MSKRFYSKTKQHFVQVDKVIGAALSPKHNQSTIYDSIVFTLDGGVPVLMPFDTSEQARDAWLEFNRLSDADFELPGVKADLIKIK